MTLILEKYVRRNFGCTLLPRDCGRVTLFLVLLCKRPKLIYHSFFPNEDLSTTISLSIIISNLHPSQKTTIFSVFKMTQDDAGEGKNNPNQRWKSLNKFTSANSDKRSQFFDLLFMLLAFIIFPKDNTIKH